MSLWHPCANLIKVIIEISQMPFYVHMYFLPHCSATGIIVYHLQASRTQIFNEEQCDLWLSVYYFSWEKSNQHADIQW